MLKATLLIILTLSLPALSLAQQLYDLKDLEALERMKTYEEFLLHVNDIRPSERGKHWREMYQSMSMGFIEYKIRTKDFTPKTFNQIELMGRSSALIDDEFFQLKRATYAPKYFNECFKKTEDKPRCENELSSFWYFSNKDPDIGLELADILEKYNSNANRWPLYQPAITSQASSLFCDKPKIQKMVVQKINLETFKENFDNNYKNLLKKYVPDTCFIKLVPSLKDALISPYTNGADKELAMNLLEAKSLLTSEELDLYAILFLLNGPVVGDKMNAAWKKVEFLNDSYSKRQKILSMIQKLEVIPDKIFKDPTGSRNKAIINLFAKNFPEFLDYYGKSCLDYIAHKETFNISSSYQCQQFFKSAKENNLWLSDAVKSKYSALKK